MKKRFLLIGLTLLFVIGASSATLYAVAPRELFNFRTPSQEERLPSEALTFVNSNYPESRIVNVDLELLGYEVYLDNGTTIDFNFNGTVDWIERSYQMPSSISSENLLEEPSSVINAVRITERETSLQEIPLEIEEFLNTQYPDETVVLIKEDHDGYDVYLSNGLEIEFDFDGSIYIESDLEDEVHDDVVVEVSTLPENVMSYIETNYPNQTVILVEQDDDGYDVYLSNGLEIEFDFDGSIDVEDEDEEDYDQDSEDIVVAYDTVPEFVSSYIETNYPNQTVILVEQDDDGVDVYLSNGLEIEFDFDGSIDVEDEDEEDEDDWNDWEDTIEFSSLPEIIINYISANYPGLNVLKVEWEDNEYEVTFTNQLELTFNSEGVLLEVDMD